MRPAQHVYTQQLSPAVTVSVCQNHSVIFCSDKVRWHRKSCTRCNNIPHRLDCGVLEYKRRLHMQHFVLFLLYAVLHWQLTICASSLHSWWKLQVHWLLYVWLGTMNDISCWFLATTCESNPCIESMSFSHYVWWWTNPATMHEFTAAIGQMFCPISVCAWTAVDCSTGQLEWCNTAVEEAFVTKTLSMC